MEAGWIGMICKEAQEICDKIESPGKIAQDDEEFFAIILDEKMITGNQHLRVASGAKVMHPHEQQLPGNLIGGLVFCQVFELGVPYFSRFTVSKYDGTESKEERQEVDDL